MILERLGTVLKIRTPHPNAGMHRNSRVSINDFSKIGGVSDFVTHSMLGVWRIEEGVNKVKICVTSFMNVPKHLNWSCFSHLQIFQVGFFLGWDSPDSIIDWQKYTIKNLSFNPGESQPCTWCKCLFQYKTYHATVQLKFYPLSPDQLG